jgi:hypothetical protein
MSFSNRLHNVAVRGCLTLALVVGVLDRGEAQPNSTTPAQQSQQQEQAPGQPRPSPVAQSPIAAPAAEQQKTKSTIYKSACGETDDHNDADLCEQRRMAQAAIDAVWWAGWQTKIGVAGFIAVVFSLFFTGWAAVAAGRAAKAAQASVKVASETAERELRAYVSVTITNLNITKSGDTFLCTARLKFANSGQTPAYRFAPAYRFKVLPAPLPDGHKIDWPDRSKAAPEWTINPQMPHESSAYQLVKLDPKSMQTKKERLYLIGEAIFTDAFKSARGIRFCGFFDNAADLAELAAGGAKGTTQSNFQWAYQENDDPDPS